MAGFVNKVYLLPVLSRMGVGPFAKKKKKPEESVGNLGCQELQRKWQTATTRSFDPAIV